MRSVIFFIFLFGALFAQQNPMDYQRWNQFDINKIRTEFNNTGLLCNGNEQSFARARPPAFEYPSGSGISWGTGVGVVIGAPIDQQDGAVGGWPNPADDYYAFCDATLDEGPAAFWNEEHFFPYPEFVNGDRALMSDDPETWPVNWPSQYPRLNDPVQYDVLTGWPGFGHNGEKLADQESFSVVEAWGGTDQLTSTGPAYPNFLKTQMIVRGMAWKGSLYENFIVWIYVIRNIGTAPVTDMRAAIHADFSFVPQFLRIGYDDDRHYYDPVLQLAYGTDDNGYEENPNGGVMDPADIPWAGVVALEMPGTSKKVATYDAFHFWQGATTNQGNGARPDWYFKWNIENINDPEDSNGDGIDDDFDHNGIPDAEEGGQGYYLGLGADGLQVLGSEPFVLNPGDSDTLIFATVFGSNEKELKNNTKSAILLFENNWEVVEAPPAPDVEAIPGDRKVTLVWSTQKSESDEQFQGYKIYRSADGGQTWGSKTFKDFDGKTHFIPLQQYDLQDNIAGNYKTISQFAWFDLGKDDWSQIRREVEIDTFEYFDTGDSINIFIDRDVINGLKYRYYIAAYDSGNGITGPLENSAENNPLERNNTVEVIPQAAVSLNNLDQVRVVPNPYNVAELWEQGLTDKQIQFTHLPQTATIRIFNSAGEQVKKIEHSLITSPAPSISAWNLRNEFNQLVAPGVYFYHVKSNIGEKKGKFIIIL